MFQINDNLVLRIGLYVTSTLAPHIGLYVTSTLAPHIGLYVGLHVTPPSQLRAVSLRFRLAAASHCSGSPKLFYDPQSFTQLHFYSATYCYTGKQVALPTSAMS